MRPDTRVLLRGFSVAAALAGLVLIICAQRLFHPGYFTDNFDDRISYAYFLETFRNYVADGVWYPRWMHRLYGGYGYPTFLLRQPGFWFFSLPFAWLIPSPVVAFKCSGLAIIFLWLSALYKITRFFGTAPLFAFATVILLVMLASPPMRPLVDASGTSQSYAYSFALWGVYFFLEVTSAIADSRRFLWSWAGLIIASTAVLYTHPFIAVFYALVVLGIFIGQLIHCNTSGKRKMLFISSIAAGLIALALSSPYWFTTWYFSDKVFYGRGLVGFLTPDASFARGEATDRLYANSWQSYFFYMYRWYLFPLIAAYVIYGFKEYLIFVAMAGIYVFSTFMMRPASLSVWHSMHCFAYLQYIWRFHYLRNMVDVCILARFAAMMSSYVKQNKYAWGLVSVLVIYCLSVFQPFANGPSGIDYYRTKFFAERRGLVTFAGSDILQPRTSDTAGLKNRFVANIPLIEMAQHYNPSDVLLTRLTEPPWHDIRAVLEIKKMPLSPVHVRINQLYFPGWAVTVNGLDIPFQNMAQNVRFDFAANGRMRLEFAAPGHYDIHAQYSGAPYWLLRNVIIALVSIFTLAGFLYYYRRHERSLPPLPADRAHSR